MPLRQRGHFSLKLSDAGAAQGRRKGCGKVTAASTHGAGHTAQTNGRPQSSNSPTISYQIHAHPREMVPSGVDLPLSGEGGRDRKAIIC